MNFDEFLAAVRAVRNENFAGEAEENLEIFVDYITEQDNSQSEQVLIERDEDGFSCWEYDIYELSLARLAQKLYAAITADGFIVNSVTV